MIRHIVLLSLKETVKKEAPAGIAPAILASLRADLEGLLAAHFPRAQGFALGPNLADPARRHGFDLGFSMDFPDLEELLRYNDHPAHQPVKDKVRGLCDKVLAFDFALE